MSVCVVCIFSLIEIGQETLGIMTIELAKL